MEIKKAEFIISSTDLNKCPPADKPEYAFIGRSNVGKSSLINMLTGRNKLAKVSATPGKTQLINHFNIDDSWYLVDLPGYGYAKSSKTTRAKWHNFTTEYIKSRENLMVIFVLLDARIPMQQIDADFMEFLGVSEIPFVMVFTKIDKISSSVLQKNLKKYKTEMLKKWETLPQLFLSSSTSKQGKEDLLKYIENLNGVF